MHEIETLKGSADEDLYQRGVGYSQFQKYHQTFVNWCLRLKASQSDDIRDSNKMGVCFIGLPRNLRLFTGLAICMSVAHCQCSYAPRS